MNIRKKLTSFAAFSVLAVSPVIAQPTLVGTYQGVTPNGNNSFLFEIQSDNLTGSYAIELGFQGAIGNSTFFGGQVNTFSSAVTNQGITDGGVATGYSLADDTFYYDTNFGTANPGNNPFTGTQTSGYQQSPTTLFLSFGSSVNLGSPISVVQIVTPDDSISFSGIIAQGGDNYQVSGIAAVPEPTAAVLLGVGGLALLSRKRRAA